MPAHRKLHQFARDFRFGAVVHGQIRVLEIADHAEALEFLGLHADPVGRELAAFLPEGVDFDLVLVLALGAVLLFDFPFDRQAMAVPTGHIIGVIAAHLERTGDHVFQDLVERMADVQIAVGVRRAIVQHIFRLALGVFAQALVKVHLVPAGNDFRFVLRQPGAHREARLRQIERG